MLRKYAVLICLGISTVLLITATMLYPGGDIQDPNTVGFDWTRNFFSNLFETKAINGADNPGYYWAMVGIAFHSLGYGLFFLHMSKKMPARHPELVLKYVGICNIVFDFLIATPLHDLMIVLSSTLTLLGLFYIVVFLMKTRLHFFKVVCIGCMLMFYFSLYLYGAGNLGLLAIMQKVSLISSMLLILGLEYFTRREDFVSFNRG